MAFSLELCEFYVVNEVKGWRLSGVLLKSGGKAEQMLSF